MDAKKRFSPRHAGNRPECPEGELSDAQARLMAGTVLKVEIGNWAMHLSQVTTRDCVWGRERVGTHECKKWGEYGRLVEQAGKRVCRGFERFGG